MLETNQSGTENIGPIGVLHEMWTDHETKHCKTRYVLFEE
jgi:hypothetical protein